MSKIDYQALREAAERAIPAMERLLMLPVDDDLICEQELKDSGVDIDALNAFKFLAGPETVLALLDEINALEETRINDVCRIAELTKQLELAKSKLNEQREYYEGVISDGSKRIAALLRKDNLASATNIEGERKGPHRTLLLPKKKPSTYSND